MAKYRPAGEARKRANEAERRRHRELIDQLWKLYDMLPEDETNKKGKKKKKPTQAQVLWKAVWYIRDLTDILKE